MDDPSLDEIRALLDALDGVMGAAERSALAATAAERARPEDDDIARWALSGAMALSGDADGPPLAPAAPVASRLVGAAAVLGALTSAAGRPVEVDAPALLGERAALRGLGRRGSTSPGGGCRLLPTADGWVAVTLNRDTDRELVPAWLGTTDSGWDAVAAAVATRPGAVVADTAGELGLAVAALPTGDRPSDDQWRSRHGASGHGQPWLITPSPGGVRAAPPARVVDLSALWAGPLCASLLRLAGAEVVTVESPDRPDGARRGDPALHELLHAGHTFASIDLRSRDGRAELQRLVGAADVVITGARPRALEQLGLDPPGAVTERPGLTWVAITGYGATGPWRNRAAYGDDAAVAGGLVVGSHRPCFCADAVADPATGLYAAIAALAVNRAGGGFVDIALRDVAAQLARPPHAAGPRSAVSTDGRWVVRSGGRDVPVQAPRARSGVPA